MTTLHPSPLLKTALRLDAAGSLALALPQVAAADRLAPWLQLPAPLLLESGLVMLAWAVLCLLMARARGVPQALLQAVVVGNVLWAVAATGVALWLDPSAAGLALLAMHALGVLLFAALQRAGQQRSAPAHGADLAAAR